MSSPPKVPKLLSYFTIKSISRVSDLVGVYCYVIKKYTSGYAIVIKTDGENMAWTVGDWDGNICLDKGHINTAAKHVPVLLSVMKYAGVPHSEYYFSDDNKLVDMRQSLNKFASPGMLRDLFFKCIGTQEVVEVTTMTPEKIKLLKNDGNSYIIKPSRFRFHVVDEVPEPLYAEIAANTRSI